MKLRAKKLSRHIDKSYAVRNLIGIPISFVLMVLLYQAAMFAYYQFSPRTSFVDYKTDADFTTRCYVQSLVTANLPYGITKQQEVTTPPFKWVEED